MARSGLDMQQFNEAQKCILDLLSDGDRHKRQELVNCLPKGMNYIRAMHDVLYDIRKLIKPVGHHIACEFYQKTFYYRHVLLLNEHPE